MFIKLPHCGIASETQLLNIANNLL